MLSSPIEELSAWEGQSSRHRVVKLACDWTQRTQSLRSCSRWAISQSALMVLRQVKKGRPTVAHMLPLSGRPRPRSASLPQNACTAASSTSLSASPFPAKCPFLQRAPPPRRRALPQAYRSCRPHGKLVLINGSSPIPALATQRAGVTPCLSTVEASY